MPFVSLCFQLHQPRRLRYYPFFEIGRKHDYEDTGKNREMLGRLAERCYLPANRAVLDLVRAHRGDFRVSYAISGLLLEQLGKYRKRVLDGFKRLADTGCVEFVGGTYPHSLAFLYSRREFEEQCRQHREVIQELFGQQATSFMHAGLISSNEMARVLERMGYRAVLSEEPPSVLEWRSPNYVYRPKGCRKLKLLVRNGRLSEDVGLRYSDRSWSEYPLTAEKFARWVHHAGGAAEVVSLVIPYESFGERQWAETGIFEFLKHLPREILKAPGFHFHLPSEIAKSCEPVSEIDAPGFAPWADPWKGPGAWRGNHLQADALKSLYALERKVRAQRGRPGAGRRVEETWRSLQASDHFYYMGGGWFEPKEDPPFLNPYPSPYDAYINYMNILTDFSATLKG